MKGYLIYKASKHRSPVEGAMWEKLGRICEDQKSKGNSTWDLGELTRFSGRNPVCWDNTDCL